MQDNIRLYVATPTNRPISPYTSECLRALESYLGKNGIMGRNLEGFKVVHRPLSSNLSNSRHDLLIEAIVGGFTHILYIDDDMTFPDTTCDYLFRHDVGIVTGNYIRKTTSGAYPVAMSFEKKMVRSLEKSGLEEIASTGMGMFLIDLNILADVPLPYFEVPWDNAAKRYQSEDRYFCAKLVKHGVKIFVDHDLSNQIGHMGEFCYREDSFAHQPKPIEFTGAKAA